MAPGTGRVRGAYRVVKTLYLIRVNTAYYVTHLYANGIYARDERHVMILVSWIETFIFKKGVVIQMKPMKWCNDIFEKVDFENIGHYFRLPW